MGAAALKRKAREESAPTTESAYDGPYMFANDDEEDKFAVRNVPESSFLYESDSSKEE